MRDLREIELSTLHSLPTGPFIHNVFTKKKKLDVSIEAELNTELLRAVRRRRMFTVPIVCEQFLVFLGVVSCQTHQEFSVSETSVYNDLYNS